MWYVYPICVAGGFVAGAVTMFFVYHNNQKKLNAALSAAQAEAKKVSSAATAVAADVKKA